MRQWFYLDHGAQKGPIPDERFVQMFQSGQLRADTLVWTEGLAEWTCATEIENLVPAALIPPPFARLPAQSSVPPQVTSAGPMFLHIPVGRLVFMSIISWGLYEAYWMYKNWRYLKERDGLKILPFWRSFFFGIFYCYGMLKAIRNDPKSNAIEQASFSAGGLATGWIILVFLGFVLGKADDIGVNMLGMIISFPSFLFFAPVQNYINRVNAKLSPRPAYNPWSAGHIVCLVLGILIWVLVLAGLALPE